MATYVLAPKLCARGHEVIAVGSSLGLLAVYFVSGARKMQYGGDDSVELLGRRTAYSQEE